MTAAAHQLLAAFDSLDPKDQHQVAVEILRRSAATGELSDDALTEIAANVFRDYDDEQRGIEDQAWLKAQEASFAKAWDNDEDAIYDNV